MEFEIEFEWDEAKRQRGIAKHGVDMVEAALIFEGPVFTAIDARRDYGETRKRAVGMVDQNCFIVVYAERDGVIRLISAWKGGRNERSKYQARLAGRNPQDEGGR